MALFNYNRSLTLADLMKINSERVARSSDIKITKVSEYLVSKKPSFLGSLFKKFRDLFSKKPYEVLYKVLRYEVVNTKNSDKHVCIIKVPMHVDRQKLLKQKVEVYCDCADFMYRCAWVLNDHDNLFLNSSTKKNLGMAINTKPTKVSTSVACKHLYRCIEDLIDNYQDYLLV